MPRFEPGQTVKTREPRVQVDAGLPTGRHRFQLVVVTDGGQRSAPDVVTVEVQARSERPTPGGVVSPDLPPERLRPRAPSRRP